MIDTIFLILAAVALAVLGAFYVGHRTQEHFSKKYPLQKAEPPPSNFPKELLRENYEYKYPDTFSVRTFTVCSSVSSYSTAAWIPDFQRLGPPKYK